MKVHVFFKQQIVYQEGKGHYPTKKSVSSAPTKVNLSTGRAIISRQVDCWMSFEEYDQLTRYMLRYIPCLGIRICMM